MAEAVYAAFVPSLAAGKLNEEVIKHEFRYWGIPIIEPKPGKQPFDFFLPDGTPVEAKLDLRSQATGKLALEYPTLQRGAILENQRGLGQKPKVQSIDESERHTSDASIDPGFTRMPTVGRFSPAWPIGHFVEELTHLRS